MSPEMGSLLLLLFCVGATAVNHLTTADPPEEALAPSGTLIILKKPGKCPADVENTLDGFMVKPDCKIDRNCLGKMKCCLYDGRKQCLQPLDAKKNACPYFNDFECSTIGTELSECHSDVQCQGTDRCCYDNCRFQCMKTVKVKSGTCPAPATLCGISPSSPRPKPLCMNDDDCLGKKKCCTRKCRQECTDPLPSVKPGTCPAPATSCGISPSSPRPKPLCMNDDDCPGKKKCCTRKCRQECTDPLPSVKSGTCPAPATSCGISPSSPRPKPLCMNDDDCPGKKKCCTPKCRQECIDPLPSVKSGTCPAPATSCGISPSSPRPKPLCMNDDDCPGKKKCCTRKCRQECTDPLPSVKSGTCPAPATSCGISPSSPRPKPLCMNDDDCPGKKKCCTPKCRQECIDPLPSVKSGTCPAPATSCGISPSSPRPKPLCMNDDDCPGKKKCCTRKCRQECTDPLPSVKPGTCPAPATSCGISPSSPRPKPLCMNDDDCLGKQKCCTRKCRQECTDPLPSVKPGTCPAPATSCGISPSSPRPKPLCMSDDDCLGKQKCCTRKCRQECTDPLPCPPIPLEKPGTCPTNVDYPVEGSMFQNDCAIDQDCQDTRKCCFSGGRRQCLLPLQAKENACPLFNTLECITVRPSPTECHSDDQCQGTERCCYYWCRNQCTPTVTVKPGKCLISVANCTHPPPPPTCMRDSDCLGNKKCCIPECGIECSDPLPR
ncbi:uncharacterized protein LOC143989238 isoform X3 [Lithobates pipiens]